MIVQIHLSQLCAHGSPMQNTVFQVKSLKVQSHCGWGRYQPNLIIFQISFMGIGTQLLQLAPMQFCEKWENRSTLIYILTYVLYSIHGHRYPTKLHSVSVRIFDTIFENSYKAAFSMRIFTQLQNFTQIPRNHGYIYCILSALY